MAEPTDKELMEKFYKANENKLLKLHNQISINRFVETLFRQSFFHFEIGIKSMVEMNVSEKAIRDFVKDYKKSIGEIVEKQLKKESNE